MISSHSRNLYQGSATHNQRTSVEINVEPMAKLRTPSSVLSKGMQSYASATSSSPVQSIRSNPSLAARRREDEARIQQLRGVFAAYDGDSDSWLTIDELRLALLALGIQPTGTVVDRFKATAATHPSLLRPSLNSSSPHNDDAGANETERADAQAKAAAAVLDDSAPSIDLPTVSVWALYCGHAAI